MVFNVASALAKINGKEEDDMKYMEHMVDYMSRSLELEQDQELRAVCKNVLLGAFRAQIVILTASAKSREMVNFVEELRDIHVVSYRVGRIEDGLDYLLEFLTMSGENWSVMAAGWFCGKSG
jgi:hypothetical protein